MDISLKGASMSWGGVGSSHQTLLTKVNADRGYELSVKSAVRILIEQAGLAHAGVAEHQELEQIVVVNVGGRHTVTHSS